ncbi:hypothetical protein GZH53_07920 [Flavihumibacter sp. R14]|nr:hypothetical protein [Flavihumibacter soli]
MKKLLFLNLACLVLLFACKKDDSIIDNEPQTPVTQTLSGSISENMTLKADVRYLLKGQVYVKNNATLTIPAGVTIEAEKIDGAAEKSALIVSKGAKLVVNGTADLPVVFTSAAASKAPGDWIGIIVLGKAPTNLSGAHIMGLAASTDTEFGGDVPDDNSGSIQYARIEYTGGLNAEMEEEWELDKASGFSLMGVGSATKVEHVMVSNSRDDGFQFVGGNVNAKYLLAYNDGDDDFDFDRGYTGKLQFLVAYRTGNSSTVIRGNGMESLNDKGASEAQPYTRPVISNMTILGPAGISTDLTNQSQGIYIRRNTRFVIRNSVIAGYTNGGLMMCPKTKPLLVNNLGSQFKFNIVNADVPERAFTYDDGPTGIVIVPDPVVARYATESTNIEKEAVNRNAIVDPITELKFQNIAPSVPNLTPMAGSAALTGSDFADNEYAAFFTNVTFRGAIGTENWTIGKWTNWR